MPKRIGAPGFGGWYWSDSGLNGRLTGVDRAAECDDEPDRVVVLREARDPTVADGEAADVVVAVLEPSPLEHHVALVFGDDLTRIRVVGLETYVVEVLGVDELRHGLDEGEDVVLTDELPLEALGRKGHLEDGVLGEQFAHGAEVPAVDGVDVPTRHGHVLFA